VYFLVKKNVAMADAQIEIGRERWGVGGGGGGERWKDMELRMRLFWFPIKLLNSINTEKLRKQF
jgi:hypothetical protein